MTEPRDEAAAYVRVYLVSSGDYSDYSVQCVFLYKEDADEYIRIFTENGNKKTYMPSLFVEERDMWTKTPILATKARGGVSDDVVFDPHTKEVRYTGNIDDDDSLAWKAAAAEGTEPIDA